MSARACSFCLMFLLLPANSAGVDEKKPVPTSWGYVEGHVAVQSRPVRVSRKSPLAQLEHGALVQIIDTKSKGGASWTRIAFIEVSTLRLTTGWVESNSLTSQPLDAYPPDAELLKQLGPPFWEDMTASNAAVARFLVKQGSAKPALLCFIGGLGLPNSRLQVFRERDGKFVPGPALEYPASEMKSGITRLEPMDLLGDGGECLVTEEPFSTQLEMEGVNMVIRKIEGQSLVTLWRAPLEYRNLASFPPQRETLQPPEMNIGTAGTVTKGEVEFRARGALKEPVWRGTIEFHVPGREAPVDTVKLEKVCAWDGYQFAPLK